MAKKKLVKKTSAQKKTKKSQSQQQRVVVNVSRPVRNIGSRPATAKPATIIQPIINIPRFAQETPNAYVPARAPVVPPVVAPVVVPVAEPVNIPAVVASGAAAIKRNTTPIAYEAPTEESDAGFGTASSLVKPAKQTAYLKVPAPKRFANPSPFAKSSKEPSIKKYFKPVEESMGFSQSETMQTSAFESPLNSEREYYKQFSQPTGKSSESESMDIQQESSKMREADKLNIRYKNAFGEPYTGGNIKQKDYRAMIQERERFNRTQKSNEELLKEKRQYNKKSKSMN